MATEFKEITRMEINDTTDLVVSRVIMNGVVKGSHINSYVRTQKYTGFAKGGVFVPVNKMDEFSEMIKNSMEGK